MKRRTYHDSTLEKILLQLPRGVIEKKPNYRIYNEEWGIEPKSLRWFDVRGQVITGSKASYALSEATKSFKPVKKVEEVKKLYYNWLQNNNNNYSQCELGLLGETLYKPCKGITLGFWTKETALLYGRLHERSAILTLLNEYINDDAIFQECGMKNVHSDGDIRSTPDGIIIFNDGSKAAVEVKSSFFNGRRFAFQSIPWRHYLQLCLEMKAFDCDRGIYVSWSPVGCRIFEIERSIDFDQFCDRIINYLKEFLKYAKNNQSFEQFNNKYQRESIELQIECKRLASSTPAVRNRLFNSWVDTVALVDEEMNYWIKRVDQYHSLFN